MEKEVVVLPIPVVNKLADRFRGNWRIVRVDEEMSDLYGFDVLFIEYYDAWSGSDKRGFFSAKSGDYLEST